MIGAIAAVAPDWGIGDGSRMLYRLPGDLKFFKQITLGHPVVMGRRTLLSLPGGKPLPGRENIVLTRDPSFQAEDVRVCRSLAAFRRLAAARPEEIFFVIGGGEIYRKLLPDCGLCYLTMVETEPPVKASVFFPDLSRKRRWEMISASEPQEENAVKYRFTVWKKLPQHRSMT